MKVALISPYSHLSSIGIRSISAYLKKNGISTKLIFIPLQKSFFSRQEFTFYPDKVVNELIKIVRDCDIIGISLMSNYYDSIKDLTLKLKKLSIPIVWGGTHPMVSPDNCPVDYICRTEGEKWFLKLCKNDLHNIHETIKDLTELPFPDYDLQENYVLKNKKFITLTEKNFCKFMGATYWTIYTRGCPFHCAYCCNNAFRKVNSDLTKLRAKSPEYIVEEIQALKRFNFKYILFADDTFFALKEEKIKEFCDYYKKHINLPFIVSGINPLVFSEKKYEYMVKAGLIRSRMGIQSGSRRILKMYQREQRNERVIEISQQIQKYKIVLPAYDIILDNPWETKQDKLDTIDLLSKLKPPFTLNVFSLVFFPGTDLYDKAKQEGIDTKLKHYLKYQPTYLNLIITLFGIFKVPAWLIKFLLKTKFNFPFLHTIIFYLTLYRRGINSISKKDFSMFPLLLQRVFCKIYKKELY